MIEDLRPDHVHIATEGPLGLAASYWCVKNAVMFTTSYHTRFPEYVEARWPIPAAWSYAALRRFHAASAGLMVATKTMADDLAGRGFERLMLWPRGVDRDVFRPVPERLDLPRPCFLYCGRLAPEKNIEAFLSLDLPGCKVVVGDGPSRQDLQERYPQALFMGMKSKTELPLYYSNADVFVFPSLTDTFGNVILEALACGAPVAAFPAPGPIDIIGQVSSGPASVGALDEDLRAACLRALDAPREAACAHAALYSWDESARAFLANVKTARAAALTGRDRISA